MAVSAMNVWVRRSGTANQPAVALTAGPGGGPALTFDRAQAQFLDGGAFKHCEQRGVHSGGGGEVYGGRQQLGTNNGVWFW